jgi:hypothetical protein
MTMFVCWRLPATPIALRWKRSATDGSPKGVAWKYRRWLAAQAAQSDDPFSAGESADITKL